MAIITISRGTFTGGQALAECLASRLGYRCLSREVILDAAAAYGVPVERFIEAMEKPPSFWERLTGELSEYLNYTRAALLERARAGNLVYHGYAGHLLLPGVSDVIRVRAIADSESRIKTAMERDNVERNSRNQPVPPSPWIPVGSAMPSKLVGVKVRRGSGVSVGCDD